MPNDLPIIGLVQTLPSQKCTTEYTKSCSQVCITDHYTEKCEDVREETPVESCKTEFEEQRTDVLKEVRSVRRCK